jgi:hypothetical protein
MSLIQRENNVGLVKGSTWGTAVEPIAGDGIFVKAHTPPKGARKIITNEDELGRGMATTGEVLEHEGQSGSLSMRLYAEGLEHIIASLMGTYAHADNPDTTYSHTFKLATSLDSIFHTIAWDEGSEVKAVNSAKIVSGTFGYADGLNLDLNYLGDKVSITSFTNPLGATATGVGGGIFKLSGATVQINGLGDADFVDGDKLHPSGVSVAITRGFEALAVTAGNDSIDEPIEKTAPVIEVTLNFPKKETATAAYFSAFNSGDYKKMAIKFTGEKIGATEVNSELAMYFPKMMIMEAPDFAQDTPIPTTIKLKVLKADAAPNGMTYDVPYIVLKNGVSTALTEYPAIS